MTDPAISIRYAVKTSINHLIADFGNPNMSISDIHHMTNADADKLSDVLIEFHRHGYLTIPNDIRSIDPKAKCIKINTYIETCPFGEDFKTPFNPKNAVSQEWPISQS
jgi:hypothetical protein